MKIQAFFKHRKLASRAECGLKHGPGQWLCVTLLSYPYGLGIIVQEGSPELLGPRASQSSLYCEEQVE